MKIKILIDTEIERIENKFRSFISENENVDIVNTSFSADSNFKYLCILYKNKIIRKKKENND